MVGEGDVTTLPALTLVDETGSTNDDVRELGRGTAPAGSAVAALRQTAGRGRRGHVWESPAGGLYLSVLLRPRVPQQQLMGLAAVCALGALDALRDMGATSAALKWPNDVVAGHDPHAGKLAGILMEAGVGDAGVFAICGIGVNVVRPPEGIAVLDSAKALEPAYLEELVSAGTSVISAAGVPDHEAIAVSLRDHIMRRCDAWEADVHAGRAAAGPLAPILSEYFDCIPLLGHQVEAVYPDGRPYLAGVFAGIDVWGRATIHTDAGRDVDVAAEQVSIRAR